MIQHYLLEKIWYNNNVYINIDIFWFLRMNNQLKMYFTLVMNSIILNFPFTTFTVCCLWFCIMWYRHYPEWFIEHQRVFYSYTKSVKGLYIFFQLKLLNQNLVGNVKLFCFWGGVILTSRIWTLYTALMFEHWFKDNESLYKSVKTHICCSTIFS